MPPLLVAVQVSDWPTVSVVIVVGLQPDDDEVADSASTTLHCTVTSATYQALLPSVPVMVGVITGGVAVGARSRSRAVFRSSSPMMDRCGSATKRSTRPFTCKAVGR